MLKKLNCVSGGIYQKETNHDGTCRLDAVYTIPRRPERNATYQAALDHLPVSPNETHYQEFLATLPFVGQSQEKKFFHIFELPNFGLLVLVKNREALNELLIKSLTQLVNKFAASAVSCVNGEKLRQSEERYRMLTGATFDGIVIHEGPIIKEINVALANILKYELEELIGGNIFHYLDPECHHLARKNAETLVSTPYELIAIRKDNVRLPIEVTDRELIEAGHTYRVTAVRNLSQQKQLETELVGLVERRTRQVQIATEVAQAIAAAANLEDLYKRIVTEVTEKFGYYHAQVLRYDPQLDAVKLAAGYGVVGEKMLALGHQIPLNQGLIGAAAAAGETFLRPDLANDPNWKANQLLPETRGEIAVPIKLGDQILGVLDVQSNQANALDEEDQMLLEGLCGQIAVAINTTRLTTDLLETSTFLNSVIDNIPSMIFVKDAEELRFIRLNKVGQAYFGKELDQIAGKNDFDFFPEEQAAFFVAKDKEVLASGELLDIPEETFDSPFGTRVLHTTKVPVMGSDGSPKYLLGISRDITERKQTAELLQANERRYQQILDAITHMVLVKGAESRIIWANKAFRDYYGMSNEALQAIVDAPFNAPDYTQQYVIDDAYVFESGQVLDIPEEIVTRHDGHEGIFHTVKSPIFNNNNEVIMTVGVSEEISARKQTEDALQQSQQALQEILEKQQDLHTTGLELADIDNLDELYQQVVKQGVERLGFDRIGLYLLDLPTGVMTGAYGIDPHGEFRSEKDDSFSLQNEPWIQNFIYNNEHLVVYEDTDLYEKQNVIGRGWHMVAALWIENTPVGVLFADNLLSQEPLKPYQPDLLKAYSASIANLIERKRADLERETLLQGTARQAAQLQAVASLSTQAAIIQEPQTLMEIMVQETQRLFDLYHCHIFLLDEAGKYMRIQACGWHPSTSQQETHDDAVIEINSKRSLVAQAARTGQPVVVNDVLGNPNWLQNEQLPDTRSEMAAPMVVGERVIGVLDVQSDQLNHFTVDETQIYTTLAAQLAIALENARSFKRSEQAVEELNLLTRRLTREGWNEYLSLRKMEETGFMYEKGALTSLSKAAILPPTVEMETAVLHTNGGHSHALNVHGEAIGHLTILDTEQTDTDTDEENAQAIIQAVVDQLSARIENIRLAEQTQDALAQTQTQAQRLQLLNEVSTELSNQATLQEVIDLFITRMPELLSVDHISLLALKPDGQTMKMVAYRGADATLDAAAMPDIPMANSPMAEAFKENRLVTGTYDELSTLTAPLFMGKRPFGALSIASASGRPITPQDESILQQLATILSSIIENKQLLATAQTRADRERLVRTITDKIRRGTDREAILAIARDEISQMLGAREAVAQLGTKNQLLERLQQTTQEQKRLTIDD
ncbi:MAG: GAF domain-containing protein [Chloroflexota bacterium]